MGLYEKIFEPKILVPWDTLGVPRGPFCLKPHRKYFATYFFEGPETPPGGRFHGEFNFYWPSLQPPVNITVKNKRCRFTENSPFTLQKTFKKF